jgi:hypothetical protein
MVVDKHEADGHSLLSRIDEVDTDRKGAYRRS